MATTPPPYTPNDPQMDPCWQRRAAREQAKANRDAWRAYGRAQREQARAYRRGFYRTSIIGPLLLIAVGVVFLMVHFGHLSYANVMDAYGRWWPVLLIAIGVIRLVEWMVLRNRTQNGVPVRYVLGGGTRFLIFLVVILGIGLSFASNHSSEDWSHWNFNSEDWNKFAGTKHENDPAPVVHALPANASVFIRNPSGDVTVNGLSDDGQLHLQAHNEVYVRSDSDAENHLHQLDPTLDVSGNTLSITAGSVESGHANLTVSVPPGTGVTINADHGDIHVGNLKAGVTVTANHGDVDVKAITGTVSAHVNNRSSEVSVANVTGSVNLEGRGDEVSIADIHGPVAVYGEFYSSIHLQHVTSKLTFKSIRTDLSLGRLDGQLDMGGGDDLQVEQAVGPVIVNTKNRNVSLTRVNGDVTVGNSNGTVTIDAVSPVGAISVENRSGSVTVSLPQNSGITVQADTSDGEVHSDFSLSSKTSDNAGSLTGTANGGGKAIRVSTTHGDISLRHGNLPPLPLVPPVPPAIALPPVPPLPPNAPDEAQDAVKQAQEELKEAQRKVKEAQDAAKKAREEAKQTKKQDGSY